MLFRKNSFKIFYLIIAEIYIPNIAQPIFLYQKIFIFNNYNILMLLYMNEKYNYKNTILIEFEM
jgi:hypothetical protein